MFTSAPGTLLDAAGKIVNNTDTFLPWPDFGCHFGLQVSDFLGVVLIDMVFQIAPEVEIWGV